MIEANSVVVTEGHLLLLVESGTPLAGRVPETIAVFAPGQWRSVRRSKEKADATEA